ncbi:MAG TPA: VOC family protein [Phototrophicaceae bacterium]|jgi:glyoxylase I family protein|nr:VOC family protein [Phototrophicaceae bacterium]
MLKSIQNLDYTVILCRDTDTMKSFYQNVLGFRLVRDFGTWVEFQVGGVLLTLRTRGTGYDEVRQHDGESLAGSASLQLAFRVAPSEVDSCFTELSQQKVTILQQPTPHPETGHRTLFFTDPEHNILEIYAEIQP